MSGSVAFDRAAEFYDRTRSISDEAMARTVEVLGTELAGRGRVLEVGVGTGLLALPLHASGLRLTGIDLARPMLRKLVEKGGGAAPFPLVIGDGTRLPFRDGAFGAAYLRWVLHLVGDWPTLLGEVVRVVRPGGAFLANLGAYTGERVEVQRRFVELVGISVDPIGLGWDDFDGLDRELASLGARPRELPSVRDEGSESLGAFIDGIAADRYSWTWSVPEADRLRAHAELVGWARDRFGDATLERRWEHDTRWRAYDLPGGTT
ncbi:MAG: class I SAM-dependent methyltransferase [Actinomycetota bacterium]